MYCGTLDYLFFFVDNSQAPMYFFMDRDKYLLNSYGQNTEILIRVYLVFLGEDNESIKLYFVTLKETVSQLPLRSPSSN